MSFWKYSSRFIYEIRFLHHWVSCLYALASTNIYVWKRENHTMLPYFATEARAALPVYQVRGPKTLSSHSKLLYFIDVVCWSDIAQMLILGQLCLAFNGMTRNCNRWYQTAYIQLLSRKEVEAFMRNETIISWQKWILDLLDWLFERIEEEYFDAFESFAPIPKNYSFVGKYFVSIHTLFSDMLGFIWSEIFSWQKW